MSTPRRTSDPPAIAPPNGRPGIPPPAPVFAVTGNARADAVLTTLDITIAPFRDAPPPEQGAAGWVAQGLGGVLGVINAPMMFIDAAASQGVSAVLDALGLSALFPALPVATIGLSSHLGTPHTHVHPPSLVPPAPPIPLPSLGIAFLAGSASVLVGGVPALRAGDIGIGLTCGSMAPPFEIMTGASGVYFAGSRVARFGMDITFHCNPVSPMGGFAIGMGVAGIVAGVAGAAAQASAGNAAAAIAQGVQAALDAAAMAVSALRGKDPAGPPGVGVLIGAPMGNVMAGGPPIPNIGALAQGRLYSALGRALRSMSSRIRRRTAPPDANGRTCEGGEPVHVVTGENYNTYVDFVSVLGGFSWRRFYSSRNGAERGVMGHGWRHVFETRLLVRLHRIVLEGFAGETIEFPRLRGAEVQTMHGYRLRRLADDHYVVEHRRMGRVELKILAPGGVVAQVVGVVADGATIELRYDTHRRLAGIVERRAGRGTESATYALRYDDAGQLAELWGSRFGTPAMRLMRYEYDRVGNLVRAEDSTAAADTYRYDGRHQMVKAGDRIGYGFTWSYDTQGRCTKTSGSDGLWAAQFEYIPAEQTTKMTVRDGAVYTFRYDEDGVITRVTGPMGDVKERIRDADGRVVAEVIDGGIATRFIYDDAGAMIARRNRFDRSFPPSLDASGVPVTLGRHLPTSARGYLFGGALPDISGAATIVERKHDRMGKVVFERDGIGREQRWTYDAAGNETSHTDRDGRTTRTEIIRWGLVGGRVDGTGATVRYQHDAHQKITRVVDGGGTESRYVYDARDRVIEVHRHGRLRESYEWDLGHRLVAKYDGQGRRLLKLERHRNGLVGRIERGDGGTVDLDYDRHGKVTRADTESHRVRRSWTAFDEVELDECDGRVVAHAYDNDGTITTIVAGRFVSTRKRRGGILDLVDPTGAARVVHHGADGSLHVHHPNGTNERVWFDVDGHVTGRDTTHATTRRAWSIRHQYTPHGDLVATSDTMRGEQRFAMDAAHRLVGVQLSDGVHEVYAYDAAGNLVALPEVGTLHLGSGNRLHTVATERFHYDDRARLSSRSGHGDRQIAYTYDDSDQLVRVEDGLGDPWTATYDGLGRRVTFGRGDRKTRLWWDGDRVAASESPDGTFRVYQYADHRSLLPLGFVDYDGVDAVPSTGRSYTVFCDQVGLPLHIEDRGGHVVWWADAATPYGELFVRPGNAIEYALRFPGHWYDADLRLHYNRFRDYDPRLGRYLQPDPLGIRGGVNLYAYPGNPLVAVDVLGLTNHNNGENGPPHDESGETRPNTEDPNDTPETPPRMSREEAVKKAHDAANEHRLSLTDEVLAAEGFRPNDKGVLERPACSAGVVDTTTGAVFVAHNRPKRMVADTNVPHGEPGYLHPLVRERVIAQQGRHDAGLDHFSNPGTHAEVLALNDAMLARDPGPEHTLTDPAVFGDFVEAPIWNKDMGTDRNGLERPAGSIAGCCGHCNRITEGVHNPVPPPGPIDKPHWPAR
jgi:RHS repeat-associated protein